MVKIRIHKCRDRKFRETFRRIVRRYISEHMSRKRRLNVLVLFVDNLLTETGNSGDCMVNDSDEHPSHYHDFTIQLDSGLTKFEQISILAHELTHVKQWAQGEMSVHQTDEDITYWHGDEYDDKTTEYKDQPWEIDAVTTEIEFVTMIWHEEEFKELFTELVNG